MGFSCRIDGKPALCRKASGGAGSREVFQELCDGKSVRDVSPDGRFLMFRYGFSNAGDGFDLWILPLFGDRKPFPYVTGPGDQLYGQFSPDGRWVAYTSTETGRNEVYVAPFPRTGAKWQVSQNGGMMPRWRRG